MLISTKMTNENINKISTSINIFKKIIKKNFQNNIYISKQIFIHYFLYFMNLLTM